MNATPPNTIPYISIRQHEKTGYYIATIWWPYHEEFANVNDFYEEKAIERAIHILYKCWPFTLAADAEIRVVKD